MASRRYLASFLAAHILILTSSPASAEEPAAAAERLFNEARKLVKQGKYAEACPKLEESDRLDHALGTQFNLADCYEHTARVAMARAMFLRVALDARAAGKKDRERSANDRATALDAKLVKLTIVSSDPNVEVRRNDAAVPREQLGKEEWLDPGSIVIVAHAAGRKDFLTEVTLGAGESRTVTIPQLAPEAPTPPTGGPSPTPDKREDYWGPHRIAAVGAAGAGVVAIGIGAVFGAVSLSKHNAAEEVCPVPNPCGDQDAATKWSDATSAGTVSTVAIVVGVVLAGAGAVLWFTAPKSSSRGTAASNALLIFRW